MATISFLIPDEIDEYISNSIKKLFDGKHGAKKRALMAAVKIFADRSNGLNMEEQYQKALLEIKKELEDQDEKKCSVNDCHDTPTHLSYGKPVCDSHFEDKRKKAFEAGAEIILEATKEIINPKENKEKLPEIARVNDIHIEEVCFASAEEEPIIQASNEPKQQEITKPQPVQVGNKSFPEYDGMTYEQLIEAKTKFSDFKTEDDTDRYNYIIKKMINIKRTA